MERLINHSQKIAAARPELFGADYMWRSERFLVWVGAEHDPPPAVQIDIETGKVTELTAFDKAMRSVKHTHIAGTLRLSPNHNMVLWFGFKDIFTRDRWFALSLDGRHLIQGKFGGGESAMGAWTVDSSRWVRIGGIGLGPTVEVHSLASTDRCDEIEMPPPHTAEKLDSLWGEFSVSGVRPDGMIIAVSPEDPESGGGVLRIPLDLGASVVGQVDWPLIRTQRKSALVPLLDRVPLPPGAIYDIPVMSPDGKWLAWSLCIPPGASIADPRSRTSELWLSDTNGDHIRPVGYEPVSSDNQACVKAVHDLAWLPTSDRISFTFNGSIYLLSVAKYLTV